MKIRAALTIRPRNFGEVVTFDEPVYDESISEGRQVMIEQGSSYEILYAVGNKVLLANRATDERLVTFWPNDLVDARFIGRNEPLDENAAWGYYEYG